MPVIELAYFEAMVSLRERMPPDTDKDECRSADEHGDLAAIEGAILAHLLRRSVQASPGGKAP